MTHQVFNIKQAGGEITANGVTQVVKIGDTNSGEFQVRTTGIYGGATLELGFTNIAGDAASFVPYTDAAFAAVAPFADNFSALTYGGEKSKLSVRVAAISGTTDIELVCSEI
jgi:hypothetical protein